MVKSEKRNLSIKETEREKNGNGGNQMVEIQKKVLERWRNSKNEI